MASASATNSRVVAALFLAAALLLAGPCTVALAQPPPTTPSPQCPPALAQYFSGSIVLPALFPVLSAILTALGPGAAVDCLCITLGQISENVRVLLNQIGLVNLPIGFQCATPIPVTPVPGAPPAAAIPVVTPTTGGSTNGTRRLTPGGI